MTININGTTGISGVNGSATTPALQGNNDTNTGISFDTDEVNIVTGGTTKATVDSTGNLVLDGGSDVRIELGSNGTTATNDRNHIRGDGDNIKFNSCADGLFIFEQNGTEELRIQSGGGISFNGDTAAVNALDKYEEGTWTPSLPSGGTLGNVNNATYTRVGRLVMIYLYLSASTIPNNSTEFRIGGLPYDVQGGNWYGAGQISYANTFDLSVWRPLVANDGDWIYFHRVDGSSASAKNSDFTGSADILLSIWYFTDA